MYIVGKHQLPYGQKKKNIYNIYSSDKVVKNIITSLPFYKVSKTEWKVPVSKLITRLNNTEDQKYLLLAQYLMVTCNTNLYTTKDLISICNSYFKSIQQKEVQT